jgi:hypothetical protein
LKKPIPFGKYYLLERINVGGMAEVFKAKAFGVEGFERLLAVKRILPNIAEDEEFIAMFIDEAKISVQLQHANIAQIFDLGKVEDSFFIALEYVNGKDLRSIFDRSRQRGESMPIPQACYILMQVCEGLDYAHNKRDGQGRELHLVHRDISPQNVLIGYEGEIKLIDFGIAKAAGKASKTQAGILKGKFGYMSPEQVRGLPIDRRSDIFSVGIVLYELLTSERLFVGESDFSTLEKVRNVEILPPSSYNRKIPDELERIVLKALAKDPEDRYQNAIDLHDDLQAFLYTVGELYSRKDLAAWMKKTFAVEIEEDNSKLEMFRQIAAPAPEAAARRMAAGMGAEASAAGGAGLGLAPADRKAKLKDVSGSPMGWDDEELDTQIFDKEPSGETRTLDEADLFFEDDDRTVANEPPPDMLRAATAPDLVTPLPEVKRPAVTGRLSGGPPPGLAGASPKSTLIGMPAANLPSPMGRQPTVTGQRKSLYGPLPGPTPPPGRDPRRTSQPGGFSFDAPVQQGYATGNTFAPTTRSVKPQSRSGLYAFMLVMAFLVVGGTGYWYWWTVNKPGKIQLTTVPPDATILIDNVKVGDRSPVTIEKPPGQYTLSVTRDGYVRSDQNVEVRSGQPLALAITLEASADTGFELTSDPPGGLVWMDGAPISGPNGQARTDFRAYRIPPGHHVLEIKGESRFKPWRQDIDVDAGTIRKIHATLVPATGGEGGGGKAAAATPPSSPSPAASPVAAVPPPPPPAAPAPPSLGAPSAPRPGLTGGPEVRPVAPGAPPLAAAPVVRRRKVVPKEAVETDETSEESLLGLPKPAGAGAGAAPGAEGECTITIGSRPWAEVWIDGKNTNKHTPFSDYKLPCGKHKIAFKRPDLQIDQVETITVRPGERFKQSFTLATETE